MGTVLLAIFAIVQSFQTGKQIDASEMSADAAAMQAETAKQQAKSAAASVSTALDVNREAVRARVDQFAPRVLVHYEKPTGPYLDSTRNSMPGYGEQRLLDTPADAVSDPSGRHFSFPADRESFLWFRGRAFLVNEGSSSARVRLPAGSRFIDGSSSFSDEHIGLPVLEDDEMGANAILPPGGHALFEWAAGNSVGDWAKKRELPQKPRYTSEIWLWVVVFDYREMGVVDTLVAQFAPELVVQVPGRDGVWTIGEPEHFGTMSKWPTRRNYVHEGHQTEDIGQMRQYFGVDKYGNEI